MATQLETYEDCVNEVLQYGFNDGPQVNRGRIERWVNEAQQEVAQAVDAPEFQETETLTLTQGKAKYTLPTRFLRMQTIFYPEMEMRLRPVDLQQYDRFAPKVIEGPPSIYTLYSTELWLFPTPYNSTDTLELRYIKEPAVLVNGTDVPVLKRANLYLLVYFALRRAVAAGGDPQTAPLHAPRHTKDPAGHAHQGQD